MLFVGKILLANNVKYVFSGGTIKGTVELYNREGAFAKELSVVLESLSYVQWEDLDQKSKHGEIIYFMQNFKGREHCVKQQICLFRNKYLEPASHEYDFCLPVPVNLPSSLSTTTGFVQYELVLVLDDSKTSHKLHQQNILVQKYLDIAQDPEQMLPFTAWHSNQFCWWPCKSKPLLTSITLSSTAFLPGDIMRYSILIENQTRSCDVKRVSAFVIQTWHYKSLRPKQRIKTELITLNYRNHLNSCSRNSKRFIENTFKLPENLVVSSEKKSVIMVCYRFQVLIIMKGLHQDVSIVIPIIMGSHRTETIDSVAEAHKSVLMENLSLSIGDTELHSHNSTAAYPIETIV